ncbi:MAG: ABC transporter substrate-binding protein [Blautia sp.]|nr:ABC transporter substrate-binding protein [Blautia sp.]
MIVKRNYAVYPVSVRHLIVFLIIWLVTGSSYSGFAFSGFPVEADAGYAPRDFSWSGGSGKMTIVCEALIDADTETFGYFTFGSGKIAYVRVGESEYEAISRTDRSTVFFLPAVCGEEFTVTACTTAMSVPHEIAYQLYVEKGEILGESEIEEILSPESKAAEAPAAVEESIAEEKAAAAEDAADIEETAVTEDAAVMEDAASVKDPVSIDGLVFVRKTDFQYAQGVDIYYYEGGYRYINVHDSGCYLQVPQGSKVPAGLSEEVKILPSIPGRIYLAASADMSLFQALDALSHIRFSSLAAESWQIDKAKEAMQNGDILFAGKYNEPDFEMLVTEGCDLAIESTMILHSPRILEMIEDLGIPVFIDRSSYESHPLGRTEWVKVYGAMLGREEEAESFFQEQSEIVEELKDFEGTGKKVAFFALNSSGIAVIRGAADYVPQMIELAGGRYAFEDITTGEKGFQVSIGLTMEEFYANAADADFLVYNGSIQTPLRSVAELLDKNALFRDFRAVKEGNVWCVDSYLYQATDIAGQLIRDFHFMLTGESEEKMVFLRHIS